MRGDAALTARLLLQRSGLAGLTAAAGGVVGVVATTRPWYVTVARVEMLGADQSRPVSSMPGLPGTPWAWAVLVAGLTAVVIGVALAIDRPPARSRLVLAGAAALMLVAASAALAVSPELSRVAGGEARELLEVADELPIGVEVTMWSATGGGVRLAFVAAALVAVASVVARDV